MSFKKKMSLSNWIVLVLGALFALQCILIFVCNISEVTRYIDCDMAKLFVHVREMWNRKQLLILDWEYLNTLELDCAALPAILFYGLTGNIYLAFGLSNICILGIYAWTVFRIFKNNNKIYPLLFLNLLVIPYDIGMLDYFNMMFFNGGQYGIKVLLPLMMISILTECSEKVTCRKLPFITLYFALLFLTSFSSGIYVFVSGIFPVFAGYALYRMYCRQKWSLSFWGYGVLSTLTAGLGLVSKASFARVVPSAKGVSMTLCSIWDIKDNISSCFLGIFELFDAAAYEEGISVMSFDGIHILSRILFVILLLVCGIYAMRKCLQRESTELNTMLLCIFAWNLFILCVCKTAYGAATYEYRYHLMGMVPILLITTILLTDWYEIGDKGWKYLWMFSCLVVLLVLNVTSYKKVLQADDGTDGIRALCDYAKEENLDAVYILGSSADAEICRLLDGEERLYLYVTGGGNAISYGYYSAYNGSFEVADSSALIADTRYHDLAEKVELFGHDYEYVDRIGIYKIYK